MTIASPLPTDPNVDVDVDVDVVVDVDEIAEAIASRAILQLDARADAHASPIRDAMFCDLLRRHI